LFSVEKFQNDLSESSPLVQLGQLRSPMSEGATGLRRIRHYRAGALAAIEEVCWRPPALLTPRTEDAARRREAAKLHRVPL